MIILEYQYIIMYRVGREQGGVWGHLYQCHTFQPRIQCQPVYDNQSPFIRNITSTLRVHYEYITSTLRVHYEYITSTL